MSSLFHRQQKLNTTSIIINEIESEEGSSEGLKRYYDFKSHTDDTASKDVVNSDNATSSRDS